MLCLRAFRSCYEESETVVSFWKWHFMQASLTLWGPAFPVVSGCYRQLWHGVIVCFPLLRFCKLRQSCLCAGCHSVNERLPDRHEAAESPAQALQERQQAILSTPPLRDWSEKDLLVSWRGAHLVIRSPKAVFLQSWKLIHAFYLAHLPLKTLLQPLLRIPLRMEDKFVLLFPVFYFGV